MEGSYSKIISTLRKWENRGAKVISNGTELICNVPKVAPYAWLHKIYGKPEEHVIDDIKHKLDIDLPNDFVEFLSYANGINIFSDSLSIWGVKTSIARTGDDAIQPYDVIDLNQEYRYPKSILVIGSYSWDGSIVIYDLNLSDKKVFRCHRGKLIKLNEWDSIWKWLENETERLSLIFDLDGYEVDEDIPTIPDDNLITIGTRFNPGS